jgi:hypothetical protein
MPTKLGAASCTIAERFVACLLGLVSREAKRAACYSLKRVTREIAVCSPGDGRTD